MSKQLTDLRAAAHRARGLAIGAREDRERCERTLAVLKQKEVIAAQANWQAQVALERAEAEATMGAAA